MVMLGTMLLVACKPGSQVDEYGHVLLENPLVASQVSKSGFLDDSIQGEVDAFVVTLNLDGDEVLDAPGLMEGVITPGAEPVALESLGIGMLDPEHQDRAPIHSARRMGVRGRVSGSLMLGSLLIPGSSDMSARLEDPRFRVPVWRLDPQSGRWVPTDEWAQIKKSPKGEYEWEVLLSDNLPPVFNVALPFWWRSELASMEEPLKAPTPAWVETACVAVQVENRKGLPLVGRAVHARGVDYVGLSRGVTDARGQVLLEVMRNKRVEVKAESASRQVLVARAGSCRKEGAEPMAVTLRTPSTRYNLLDNPDGSRADLTGWTLQANGGNGWAAQGDFFVTSYDWGRRTQTIDLYAHGFSPGTLASAPPIQVSEDFGRMFCPDMYYLKVELLDEQMNLVSTFDTGVVRQTGPCDYDPDWQTVSHVFTGYGPGVRYVRWQDGGKDSEWWWGHYGAIMRNAVVKVLR
ncbi:Branched-chain amino acid ABC transporter, amino acid-binding protein [Archangium gephyra]|nr:Branched-chain amino acid ABC transporter, amino acid-binding protein [Archangium gephyra]